MYFLNTITFEKLKQLTFITLIIIVTSLISSNKYKIMALFLLTILNFVIQVLNIGTMTIFSMSLGLLLNMFPSEVLLLSFSNSIIWQILCFLFLSQALIKSGLARKISIYIMYFFGKSTLTLSYGFAIITVVFASILPTSTARIGGIFIPILTSLFEILSKDDEKLKDTLLKVIIYTNTIASAMFFTASSGNFYIQEMSKSVGVIISAQDWIFHGFFPGMICLIATPILINYLINPKTRNLKKINKKIEQEMVSFDPLSFQETIILGIFIGIFPLWFLAPKFNIPFIGILFGAIFILLILDLLDFEQDILNHTEAWMMFFWMSNLLMLSSLITHYNAFDFISIFAGKFLTFIPKSMILFVILTSYGYSQYFFASSTVHASALYVLSFNIATQYGYPPFLSALYLAYVSNLFAGLTTYSASEVILLTKTFNCDANEFNKYGFIFSSFIFILWMLCAMIWRLLGAL